MKSLAAEHSGTRVSDALITNAQYVHVLRRLRVGNARDTTYTWLNIVNPNLPVQEADGEFRIKPGFEAHPVVGVSWFGALLFASAVGGRLPTDPEWSAMASSGDAERSYPWGDDDPTPELANYDFEVGATTPVRRYPPTELGFYDVAGNVREWCADTLPSAAGTKSQWRLVRGGSWNKDSSYLRTGTRRAKWARQGSDSCGFRVAVDVIDDNGS